MLKYVLLGLAVLYVAWTIFKAVALPAPDGPPTQIESEPAIEAIEVRSRQAT
jgi:hypothetical protein